MIIVITEKVRNKHTGQYEDIVSHGRNMDSDNLDEVVVLPSLVPHEIGAIYDTEIGEYVLRD